MHDTLKGATTLAQSNGNEEVTPHTPEPQNWSLTTCYNFVSYPSDGYEL